MIDEYIEKLIDSKLKQHTSSTGDKKRGPKTDPSYSVTPGEWVLSSVITAMFGMSSETLRAYKRTIWPEGIYWKKNPAGRLVYNPARINEWMGS